MIFVDLCRIKGIFSDIQRGEKQYSLARHFWRAYFLPIFKFFLKNRLRFGVSISNK